MAGKRVSGLTSMLDFAPTLCELLGIDDQDHLEGTSMWPLVTGQADKLHDRVFTQFGNFASVRDLNWHRERAHLTKRDSDLLRQGLDLLAAELALVSGDDISDLSDLIGSTVAGALAGGSH